MTSEHRNTVNRLATALMFLVIAIILFGPALMRAVSLPHSSVRLADATQNLRSVGKALREYEKEHGGSMPQSLAELNRYMRQSRCGSDPLPNGGWGTGYAYYPEGNNGAVVVCYLRYRSGANVVLWLDDKETVHAARAWLWPKWVIN